MTRPKVEGYQEATFSVRLGRETERRVKRIADKEMRSYKAVVERAVEFYAAAKKTEIQALVGE